MIKDLSEALRRLINSLQFKPVATLGAILLVSIGYIGYRSYDILQELVITPDEEAQNFESQLESATLVNAAIEDLRIDLKADTVVVKQFHNGRHDLTGIPFTESTATFYTDKYSFIGDEPLSTMNTSLRVMWKSIDKPSCMVLYAPMDSASKKYFTDYKLNKAIVCPLTNLLNYPIGTITVGFSGSHTTSEDIATDKTQAIAKSITGYLINANTRN